MRRGRLSRVLLVLWCIVAVGAAAGSAGRLSDARQAHAHCPRASPRGMILYDASPFFFAPGGRNGFAAIEAHLPAIAALGANAILLSPVTAASPGDFGYAVTDDFRLSARFGSAAQLRSLVRAAHARGLRVLLD